jgi:hypothetical protein
MLHYTALARGRVLCRRGSSVFLQAFAPSAVVVDLWMQDLTTRVVQPFEGCCEGFPSASEDEGAAVMLKRLIVACRYLNLAHDLAVTCHGEVQHDRMSFWDMH